MDLEISKLSSKGQTTVPLSIRKMLSLAPGDEIVFEHKKGEIVIRKAEPLDIAYLRSIQAAFASEWDSPEDDEAFNDL